MISISTTANLGSNNVTVLRNGGRGNFTEPSSSPVPVGLGNPRALTAANLDADGDVDLAVTSLTPPGVTILKNNGNASFFEPASSPEPAGDSPTGITAADFDADGDRDLATANSVSGDVAVLRNAGTGNFSVPGTSPEPVGAGPQSIVAGPFDADADPDLAVTLSGADTVAILGND